MIIDKHLSNVTLDLLKQFYLLLREMSEYSFHAIDKILIPKYILIALMESLYRSFKSIPAPFYFNVLKL